MSDSLNDIKKLSGVKHLRDDNEQAIQELNNIHDKIGNLLSKAMTIIYGVDESVYNEALDYWYGDILTALGDPKNPGSVEFSFLNTIHDLGGKTGRDDL